MRNVFKTLRTRRASFSPDGHVLQLTAPKGWKELTQAQLRYVMFLLATYPEKVEVKTRMLIRFTGIHVRKRDDIGWKCSVRERWYKPRHWFYLKAWQIENLLGQLSYVDKLDDMNVRLDSIRGLQAVNVRLHGVRFLDYLNAEKYYQLYLSDNQDKYLCSLASILYRKRDGSMAKPPKLDKAEMMNVFLWMQAIKKDMSRNFTHFFKPTNGENEDINIVESMNSQIRALTGGDVTKEQQIYDTDCWRALTELNRKAKEAEDLRKEYAKLKKKA